MRRSLWIISLTLLVSSCTGGNIKTQYALAERLWDEGRYEAAVVEFNRVFERDPNGKLGHQALFRKAMTEYLFLRKYLAALSTFRQVLDSGADTQLLLESKVHIGSILFESLQDYELSVAHYRKLLEDPSTKAFRPEFLYRIGRSQFLLGKLSDATATYGELITKNPNTRHSEQASFELVMIPFIHATPDDQKKADCDLAIQRAKEHLTRFPSSSHRIELEFVIASCLTDKEQYQAAEEIFKGLKGKYPTPGIIEWKLQKIKEHQGVKAH